MVISPEVLIIVAYWPGESKDEWDGDTLCRRCGEQQRLPCADAATLYAIQCQLSNRLPDKDYDLILDGPDAIYCDYCGEEIYRPIQLVYLREWAD